jgi:hypothetical protein
MEATMADRKPEPSREEHKEAVRLSREFRHISVWTLLLGGLLFAAFFSAVFMVISQGSRKDLLQTLQ